MEEGRPSLRPLQEDYFTSDFFAAHYVMPQTAAAPFGFSRRAPNPSTLVEGGFRRTLVAKDKQIARLNEEINGLCKWIQRLSSKGGLNSPPLGTKSSEATRPGKRNSWPGAGIVIENQESSDGTVAKPTRPPISLRQATCVLIEGRSEHPSRESLVSGRLLDDGDHREYYV